MDGIRARKQITLSRRVFNEQEFRKCYVHKQQSRKRRSPAQKLKKHLCENISNLTCRGVLNAWLPILTWLPQYSIKENAVSDIAGGLTVAILHIPQGIIIKIFSRRFFKGILCVSNFEVSFNFRSCVCNAGFCPCNYWTVSRFCSSVSLHINGDFQTPFHR